MRKHLLIIGPLATLGILALACGPAATPSPAEPVELRVSLTEFMVELSENEIPNNTPIRFIIENKGTLSHNFVIELPGSVDDPLEAAGQTAKVEEENLPPGATVTFEWTFTQGGDFQIACHVPGHYEAGMVSPIVVQ